MWSSGTGTHLTFFSISEAPGASESNHPESLIYAAAWNAKKQSDHSKFHPGQTLDTPLWVSFKAFVNMVLLSLEMALNQLVNLSWTISKFNNWFCHCWRLFQTSSGASLVSELKSTCTAWQRYCFCKHVYVRTWFFKMCNAWHQQPV